MHNLPELLGSVQNIALIGAKDKPGQPVHQVGQYLIQAGFTVFPVHSNRQNVWGLTTYQGLLQIPERIDLVNIFRASEYCLQHAREALQLNPLPRAFWMQQGLTNQEARDLLQPYRIQVIEDSCIMVMHKQSRES
ncbi:MAG: CoA-binding protein [Desulfohalobiaceae bacterium]